MQSLLLQAKACWFAKYVCQVAAGKPLPEIQRTQTTSIFRIIRATWYWKTKTSTKQTLLVDFVPARTTRAVPSPSYSHRTMILKWWSRLKNLTATTLESELRLQRLNFWNWPTALNQPTDQDPRHLKCTLIGTATEEETRLSKTTLRS